MEVREREDFVKQEDITDHMNFIRQLKENNHQEADKKGKDYQHNKHQAN